MYNYAISKIWTVACLCGATALPLAAQVQTTPPAQVQFAPSNPAQRSYLVTHHDGVTLHGSAARRDFMVYLTEPTSSKVLIGYSLSEHVLSTESQLALWVNGSEVSSAPLPEPRQDRTGSWHVDLPSEALQVGWNTVSLRASLTSDGICRAEGDVDMRLRPESTFVETPDRKPSATISAGIDGQFDAVLFVPDLADTAALETAMQTAQEIGLRYPEAVASLRLVDTPENVGNADVVITASAQPIRHPHVLTPQQLADTATPRSKPPETAVTALAANRSYTLSELGLQVHSVAPGRHRYSASFLLPEDFYGRHITNMRLKIRVMSDTSRQERPRLEVLVNNVRASGILMPSEQSGNHIGWTADIMLNDAMPGVNRLDFVFTPPDDAELSCTPGDPAPKEPVFRLDEDSSIELTSFAAAYSPSLWKTLSANGEVVALNVVGGDADSYSAAARILAAFARDSGTVRPVRLNPSETVPNGGLIIAQLDGITPATAKVFDLSAERMRSLQTPETSEGASQDSQFAQSGTWTRSVANWFLQKGLDGDKTTAPAHDDRAYAVSGFTKAGVRTLVVGRDGPALMAAAQQLSQNTTNAWRATQFVLAGDGKMVRTFSDARLAKAAHHGFGNMRLLVASHMSERPWVYAIVVMIAALLMGLVTRLQLRNTRKDT